MSEHKVPINKGNYSMDTPEREAHFQRLLAEGWEDEYRAYRKAWTALPRAQEVRDYPLLVDLELASVCNLKCPMCYTISPEFRRHVNTRLMDYELFRRVVDEIAGHVPALRLSLRGEATLHKRFSDCIRHAKARGIGEVSTLTHGGKLTGEFLRQVVDAGLDWITVSVDGAGETYERIRKPIKFEQIVANLTELRDYKRQRGVHRPVVKVQGIWPAIREDPDAYYEIFAPISDLVAFNPLIDYLGRDADIVYVDDFTCPQQYQRLVVGADGLVMKCSNDEENREVIGDLNCESVHAVWHGAAMQRVRSLHREPRGFLRSEVCRRCYLPRRVEEDEESMVDGRRLLIKNYVNRSQEVGT